MNGRGPVRRGRRAGRFPHGAFLFATVNLLLGGALFAQETPRAVSRFDYSGNVFVQGFYLARDLPLQRPEELGRIDPATGKAVPFPYDPVCPSPYTPSTYSVNQTKSRCREEDDFYRMRMRMDFAFRPSPFVDVLYGLEVGYLTFGREDNVYGPGSGGKGAGRTNLETRELVLKVHNQGDAASASAGIFNMYTPRGLVMATSGAGFRFLYDRTDLQSGYELYLIRSEDNSRVDDDSNGYSDNNYKNIHLAMWRWRYNGISWLRSELYGVFREDDSLADSDKDNNETSRMNWVGLYLSMKWSSVTLMLHGVFNHGEFERPDTLEYLSAEDRVLAQEHLLAAGYTMAPTGVTAVRSGADYLVLPAGRSLPYTGTILDGYGRPLPRRSQNVNAGAGQMELGWQMNDQVQVTAVGAGGTGRLGVEPDGSSSAFRSDQFRAATPAFQLTDIAVDTSGGYTIFQGGLLTGIYVRGMTVRFQIYESLSATFGGFDIRAVHTPVMDYNAYFTPYPYYVRSTVYPDGRVDRTEDTATRFTSHPGVRKATNYLGAEWNAKLVWRVWSDFKIEGRAAWFDAGDGYRALKDVGYGDDIVEVSLGATETF